MVGLRESFKMFKLGLRHGEILDSLRLLHKHEELLTVANAHLEPWRSGSSSMARMPLQSERHEATV